MFGVGNITVSISFVINELKYDARYFAVTGSLVGSTIVLKVVSRKSRSEDRYIHKILS